MKRCGRWEDLVGEFGFELHGEDCKEEAGEIEKLEGGNEGDDNGDECCCCCWSWSWCWRWEGENEDKVEDMVEVIDDEEEEGEVLDTRADKTRPNLPTK